MVEHVYRHCLAPFNKHLGGPSIVVIHIGCFCGLESQVFRSSLQFRKSPLHALYASACKFESNIMLNGSNVAALNHQSVLVISILVEVWIHSHPTLLYQSLTYPKTCKFLHRLFFCGPSRVVSLLPKTKSIWNNDYGSFYKCSFKKWYAFL